MSLTKLSVNEFKKHLKTDLDTLAKENGWDISKSTDRGYTFQLWVAQVLCNYDRGLDTEPEDSLLYSQDLKADIVLEDSNRRHLLISQCKYESISKNPPVDEGEVNDFFHRHEHYLNREWVKKHGSGPVIEALADYEEKVNEGYSVDFYFVSTGNASPRTLQLAEKRNALFAKENKPIKFYLLDFAGLKDFYIRSLSLEESVPQEVRLPLPRGRFFEKNDPHPTLVTVLKGNALRDLYKRHKEALFAWNIRGYLGNRGINEEIISTAEDAPDNFFYFNNGVSAVCTDYQISDSELFAENFQIINGAQTVGALGRAKAHSEIEVLFRLTRTASVKTEKGINRQIILYNNSQNIIKHSAFRSNDPIQIWLERRFLDLKPLGSLPKLHYARRRSAFRKAGGYVVKLEELAKSRYAYLWEPRLVHESPKSLWTHQSEGGAYEKAFGVDGEIPELWSDEEFQRCLVAIAFYLRIAETCKEEAKKDIRYRFLKRLRYHALALAGIYMRGTNEQVEESKLVKDKSKFDSVWDNIWPDARRALIDVHSTAVENNYTMHALVRSDDRWQQMRRRFVLYTGVQV